MTTAKPEDDLETLVGTKPKADEATTTQTPPAPGNVVDSAGILESHSPYDTPKPAAEGNAVNSAGTVTSHSPYDLPKPTAEGSVATDEQVDEDKAAEDQAEQDGMPPYRRPVLDSHSPYDRPPVPPVPPVTP